MKNEVTLTFGLPTYNRSVEIKDAIDSIVTQMDDRSRSRIEILICDDASTDNTAEVAKQYIERYPDICRYHRNERNLRYSGNVHQVFLQAKGRFVIPFADDDALEPGALNRILMVLDKYPDLGVAYLGSTSYDCTLSHRLDAQADSKRVPDANTPINERFFKNGIESERQAGVLVEALVSTNVIRRDLWLAEDLSPYYEGAIIHMPATARILVNHSVCLVDEPLVKYRAGYGVRWSKVKGFPFNFHFDLVEFWDRERDLYPLDIQRAQHYENVRGVIDALFRAKCANWPIDYEYFSEKAKKTCNTGFWTWRKLMLLVRCPAVLFKLSYKTALCVMRLMRTVELRKLACPSKR